MKIHIGIKRNVLKDPSDDLTRRMTNPHYTTKVKEEEPTAPDIIKHWVCHRCKCFLRIHKQTITRHSEDAYHKVVYYICPKCGYRIYNRSGYTLDYEEYDENWLLVPSKKFKPERIYEKLKINSGFFNDSNT